MSEIRNPVKQPSAIRSDSTDQYPNKKENDPCPDGWRVPTWLELQTLSRNHSPMTTNAEGQSGIWLSGANAYSEEVAKLFLPAAGALDGKYGFSYYRGCHGGYWCSKGEIYSVTESLGDLLTFSSNYLPSQSYYLSGASRRDGYSVRCVKESVAQ